MSTESTETKTDNPNHGASVAVQPVVSRFTLLRLLFHRDFKQGQRYVFVEHMHDPFKRDKLIVEILGVSGKWINYKHVGSSIWTDESMRRDSFNFCYALLGA